MRIENYALIGDCETAALVGTNGSIDWLCWPDFSSTACFAALLGGKHNGRWIISPIDKIRKITRKYREHTLILETRFETGSGVVVLTDFMPPREKHSDVVRIVRCEEGRVSMRMELCVRYDYGRTVPWTGPYKDNDWAAVGGEGAAYLRSSQAVRSEDANAIAEFTLKKGESHSFVLTYVYAAEPPPRRINVRQAFRDTEDFWITWSRINQYRGPWREEIERSLITLKALTYRPTGGIVAAPTTSLPERSGGDRNWDYRFCWVRDAALTLESLLAEGYHEEARAWQDWLLHSVGSDARQMQIMYGMYGDRHLPEYELDWLPGYERSKPVRVGNAASEQVQLDVYGELADALARIRRSGVAFDKRSAALRTSLANYASVVGRKASFGIWEERDKVEHFTYSKVMAWVTIDRAICGVERGEITGPVDVWRRQRDRLHRQIVRYGFNHRLGSFTQSFESKKLDASCLLIPLSGAFSFDDPRVQGTIRAIEKGLVREGLVIRNKDAPAAGRENAFIACSFWLVQNLAMSGRQTEAERFFEKLLTLCNDVGLLSEEYDPIQRRLLGNFPQALSHIALINAGRALAGARE